MSTAPVSAEATFPTARTVGRFFSGFLYAGVLLFLSENPATAQGPGSSVAARRAIEARLPPGAAKGGAPAEADVAAAVARTVVDFLHVALPPDLTPADIVGEAVRTRAGNFAAVEKILSAVTEALLTLDPESAVREVLDEATMAACLAVSPPDVAELVRSQIALVATSPTAATLLPPAQRPPDELLPIEAYAERIVAGGIKALRKVPTTKLARHIEDVAAKALTVAPPFLYEEVAAAAARTSSSGAVVLAPLTGGASNLLKTLLAGVPDSREEVGAIIAGVLRGRGESVIAALKVELANTRPAFTTYTDAILEGYRRTAADHGDYHITYLRQEGANFDRAGLVSGAAARWPAEVQKFTRLALELPGSNASVEIARAAGRAVPLLAPQVGAYCVGVRGVAPGEVARGLVEGAHSAVTGAIVARQLAAMGTVAGSDVREVVAGALSGALATGKEHELPALAFAAARASRFPLEVAEVGIAGAPAALRHLPGLAALAADVGPSAELIPRIEALLASDAEQRAAFATGARAVTRTQTDVRQFLAAAEEGLASARGDAARLAVLRGVTLVNPRGAAVVAAAGIARTDEQLWPQVAEAAMQSSPGKAASIQLATAAAGALRKDRTRGLAEHVLRALFLHPDRASDIAAAAVVADPERAPEIAQAAAMRTGAGAARLVPALLAFAQTPPGQVDAARTRQIVAAVVRGLLEARLRDGETAALTASVAAAVQWACLTDSAAAHLVGSGAPKTVALLATPQISLATDGALESVITAAVSASPRHGIAIARVAAETLATFTRGQFTDAEGQLAALARDAGALNFTGQAASELEIRNAIAFGITAHTANAAGARALELVNYSRTSGTGRPISAFRDE
jgi:hypothetical protein